MQNKPFKFSGTRADVVAEARTWLDTPFVHQGWTKGVACDCIGLIKGVGVELSLFDYDEQSDKARRYAAYSMLPNPRKMREGLAEFFVPISKDEALPGDIFYIAWAKEPQHVALLSDHGLIHSYSHVGKVVEHALDAEWERRICAAYRYPYFVECT